MGRVAADQNTDFRALTGQGRDEMQSQKTRRAGDGNNAPTHAAPATTWAREKSFARYMTRARLRLSLPEDVCGRLRCGTSTTSVSSPCRPRKNFVQSWIN